MNIPFLVPIGIFFANLALKLKLPVEWIIKKTIFEQFCGGVTQEDCLPLIKLMHSKHVFSVLDYSVEGKTDEEEFDKATQIKKDIIKFAAEQKEIPFAVAKPTGVGRFEIWEKVSQKDELDPSEQAEWKRVKERVKDLCQTAVDNNTRLMFDAEESWMQDAADDLIKEMMKIYNKEGVFIFNTLQCYRWDRLKYVKELHKTAQKEGFKLGFKIVRGAYMEKENARAKKRAIKPQFVKIKRQQM